MKITINSIKSISHILRTSDDLTSLGDGALIGKIGSQLGAVEEVTQLGLKYKGIVIARIVSCQKHSNADKLNVCLIDDGGKIKDVERDGDGLIQVVCGANNVRPEMTVAWLPPGATVPSSYDKDPFILESRELRGVISHGMLASTRELAIGDDHDGILEIDGNHKPGSDFAETFRLSEDVVIDIENKMFTHRPDCFGWLGITREIAGIQGKKFTSPDWYTINPELPAVENEGLPLNITNEIPGLVPRFTAICLKDIKVGPSPVWLQVSLSKVGQKPINNIVDLTNYYMLLTGQPLHAYDYDKVKSLSEGDKASIIIRHPSENETVKLLNGKTVNPEPKDIVIATNKQLVGMGGVMGGSDTEVDNNTTNIILECASFDMYSIRRASMEHGLFTDAVTRFTKGQSPLQCLSVLLKTIEHMQHFAGGVLATRVIDNNYVDPVNDHDSLLSAVSIDVGFLNSRLGTNLSAKEISDILKNVEFNVRQNDKKLVVEAPFWRTDISIPEDIVEEVGRLYGFDRLPQKLPARDFTPTKVNKLLQIKTDIRSRLSALGANELLTYSFAHGKLLEKVGQDYSSAFKISNAKSPNLQYYRLSLTPSLLEKVHPNIKAGYPEFALFEIGKTHNLANLQDDELPGESEALAFVIAANDKLKKPGASYYQAKKYLEILAGVDLVFSEVTKALQEEQMFKPYDASRSALVATKKGERLGVVGEFKPMARANLKLPKHVAGFEIDIKALKSIWSQQAKYEPLPRFPSTKQDVTLKVPTELSFRELNSLICEYLVSTMTQNTRYVVAPRNIYRSEKSPKHKNVTFRLTTANYDRTMTDKEVSKIIEGIVGIASEKYGAEQV